MSHNIQLNPTADDATNIIPQPARKAQIVEVGYTSSTDSYVSIPNPHERVSLLQQALWFLLVGWWLSQIAIVVAYLLMMTIIFIPAGVWILNRLPSIVALRHERKEVSVEIFKGMVDVVKHDKAQHPFWLRALYFVLIGWWATAILLQVAWAFTVSIIGIPIGILLYDFVPMVISLRRR